MNIKKENKHPIKFKELARGDVFESYGDFYIKISNVNLSENAYNLGENVLGVFETEDEVTKMHAEISVW